MEKDIQEQLAYQQEILRDLQSQLAQSTDEEEKKSLQLKMNVVEAKIKELQAKQSSATVNEGTPENTKDFHNELTDEQLDEDSWKVGDRVKIKDNYFDSMPSSYFNKQKGKISKVFKDYVAIELDKPVLGDKSITVAFNGLIKENANMLNESLPSNYSKSKYLKEVQDATKAIKDICNRIDNSAKRGDLYNIAGDFGAISAFAKRCEEGSKEIYSYEKKGTLTEAVLPQDKVQWADAVKFGKAHGHPAPKLKLGQKTSKGEVVALWYGRLSAAPIYSVSKDGGKTVKEYYEEELMEGCMTKKFENMTNREIASYIFSHPHTKFASKMKECDDKEIMKAIRAMKKTEEEAPVTNTSAVATTEVPSMFMKKKLNESVDSDITDILDDVKNMYGEKARRDLRDEIYHRNYLVTRDSFANYVKQLSNTGMLRDFIEAIINRDTYTFDKIVKKLK